jgi:hypothetical protein
MADTVARSSASPKTGEHRWLRNISAELAAAGHVNKQGNRSTPSRSSG